MRLPGALLVHTVTAEPYLGEGYAGPTYAEAVEVPALVDGKRGAGSESATTSSGTVFVDLEWRDTFPVGTRVTHDGHVTYVDEATPYDVRPLVPITYLAVALK